MLIRDEGAQEAYSSFMKKRKNSPKKKSKSFEEVQRKGSNYSNTFLGIKDIPIAEIVGSVEGCKEFNLTSDVVEERWCRIYRAVVEGFKLSPVVLYKIGDEYFVYEGRDRISVAESMNYKSIEAEVIEFFFTEKSEKEVIHSERIDFERETGLQGISLPRAGSYHRLIRSIWDFKRAFVGGEGINCRKAAEGWYENLYRPVEEILLDNRMTGDRNSTGEMFLEYLDYKHFLSEYGRYSAGYTYSLIDFINYLKVRSGEGIYTSFKLDKNFIPTFRNLYDLDRRVFYRTEYQGKYELLREFAERQFTRENNIIGEIDFYRHLNSIETFEEAMSLWFTEVYARYYEIFLEKGSVLDHSSVFTEDQRIVEDIVRYSREYRKVYNRIFTTEEVVLNYLLDVYLPILSVMEGEGRGGEDLYLDMSHRYLYYLRYRGRKRFIDFHREYLRKESSQNFIGSSRPTRDEGRDVFIDIKKLLIYYAPTKDVGEEQMSDFYSLIHRYGETGSFKTSHRLRESLISAMEKDPGINWVKDILQRDLESLSKRKEVVLNFNTRRVFNHIKGWWGSYSFIDYYASIISMDSKKRKGSAEEATLEYIRNNFID